MLQVGSKSLADEEEKEFAETKSAMTAIYGSGKVCIEEDNCLDLEPGLTNIMANSQNATFDAFAEIFVSQA